MHAYQYTVAGLMLDIIGAFLVSVEAIRLENLRRLRDRFLRPLHSSILPKKLTIVDDETPLYDQQPLPSDEVEFSEGLRRWFLSHTLAGVLGVSLAYLLFGHHAQRVVDFLLLWAASCTALSLIALALPAALIAFFLILAVGEAVHYALIHASRLPIAVLDVIDRNTPNGTIGIVGFAFLFFGFLLQMVGASVGHNTP